jgi:formate hydrogenlyase transcriptional activator
MRSRERIQARLVLSPECVSHPCAAVTPAPRRHSPPGGVFVQKFARRMNKSITSIPARIMEVLQRWDWPGNIRELENFIERSVILTHGSVLVSPVSELAKPDQQELSSEYLKTVEREHILQVLRETRGRIGGPQGAAARLGLKRTTLQSKLRQFGIDHRSV